MLSRRRGTRGTVFSRLLGGWSGDHESAAPLGGVGGLFPFDAAARAGFLVV